MYYGLNAKAVKSSLGLVEDAKNPYAQDGEYCFGLHSSSWKNSKPILRLIAFGPTKSIGDAIVDCLKYGVLPESAGDELCMIITVWLDPRCPDDPNLDKKDLYRTNYEATKIAIGRAMKGEPTVKELIANRDTVKHYALEGVLD